MSILEDNKIISAFMGYGFVAEHHPPQFSFERLAVMANGRIIYFEPHRNWNQLMEVVIKIAKDNEWALDYTFLELVRYTTNGVIDSITDLHSAVLEYIKQQKEK